MRHHTLTTLGIPIWLFAILGLFWYAGAARGEDQTYGNVGFVNAIDSDQPTYLKRNGELYNLRGYGSGQMTMGAAFPVGAAEFSIENATFGSASLGVDVSQTAPLILIGYLAIEKKRDGTNDLVPKMVKLASKASKQLNVVGLYASSNTNTVSVSLDGKSVSLPPWKLVPLTSKAPFTFQAGPDQRVMNISSMASGRIIVVVFDRRNEGLRATLYEDSPSLE